MCSILGILCNIRIRFMNVVSFIKLNKITKMAKAPNSLKTMIYPCSDHMFISFFLKDLSGWKSFALNKITKFILLALKTLLVCESKCNKIKLGWGRVYFSPNLAYFVGPKMSSPSLKSQLRQNGHQSSPDSARKHFFAYSLQYHFSGPMLTLTSPPPPIFDIRRRTFWWPILVIVFWWKIKNTENWGGGGWRECTYIGIHSRGCRGQYSIAVWVPFPMLIPFPMLS